MTAEMIAPDSELTQYVKVTELSAALRVSRETITRLIRSGHIKAFRMGSSYRMRRTYLKLKFPDLFEAGGPLA